MARINKTGKRSTIQRLEIFVRRMPDNICSLSLTPPEPAAQNLNARWNHRNDDDTQNHKGIIFLNVRNVAEKVPNEHDAEDPKKCANDIVGEKLFVTHRTHSRYEWCKGTNQGQKSGNHNGFRAVPFVKCVGLVQLLAIKDSALRVAEKLVTDRRTDPIVHRVPQNAGNGQ